MSADATVTEVTGIAIPFLRLDKFFVVKPIDGKIWLHNTALPGRYAVFGQCKCEARCYCYIDRSRSRIGYASPYCHKVQRRLRMQSSKSNTHTVLHVWWCSFFFATERTASWPYKWHFSISSWSPQLNLSIWQITSPPGLFSFHLKHSYVTI